MDVTVQAAQHRVILGTFPTDNQDKRYQTRSVSTWSARNVADDLAWAPAVALESPALSSITSILMDGKNACTQQATLIHWNCCSVSLVLGRACCSIQLHIIYCCDSCQYRILVAHSIYKTFRKLQKWLVVNNSANGSVQFTNFWASFNGFPSNK